MKHMNKLACGILFGIFLISFAYASSDVQVLSGYYFNAGTQTYNYGTYTFNFTVYDNLTSGSSCYTNSTQLTTNFFGYWQTYQYGVLAACSNQSKDYYLNININGLDQSPRRRLTLIGNWTGYELYQNLNNKIGFNHTQQIYTDHLFAWRIGGDTMEGNYIIDGNLTITGTEYHGEIQEINLTTDLNPTLNNTFDLGNVSNQWRNAYIQNIYTPKNIFWYNFSTVDQAYTNSVNNSLALFIANTYQTIANTFTKLEVVSMVGGNYSALDVLKLNTTDQRYNDTNKNITVQNILPETNIVHSIGSSILRWFNGWFANLDVSGNATINNLNITGITTMKNVTLENLNVTGSASVLGNTRVEGNLHVTGNVSIKRPYGMYSSTETQTAVLANTAYPITFNYTEDDYLMTKEGNVNFSVGQTGDYLIELSAIVDVANNGKTFEIWVQKTNSTGQFVNIPRSNTRILITTASTETLIVVPFILDLNPTDRFRVMFGGNNNNGRLVYTPATAYSPETPSIIMTFSKISEITP